MKQIVKYLFVLGLLNANYSIAQWQKSYRIIGDSQVSDYEFNNIDGGFILGMTYTDPPQNYILRLDSIGNKLWTKQLTKDIYYHPVATAQISNGNYLIGGLNMVFEPSLNDHYITYEIDKLNGDTISSHRVFLNNRVSGHPYFELENGTEDNYFMKYVADSIYSLDSVIYQRYICKYQNNGVLLWRKIYQCIPTKLGGPNIFFDITSLHASVDGGVVYRKIDYYSDAYAYYNCNNFFEKLDSTGNLSWSIDLKDLLNWNLPVTISSIICTKDSNYVISCNASGDSSNAVNNKSYLLKFNSSGVLIDSVCQTGTFLSNMVGTQLTNGRLLFIYYTYNANYGFSFYDESLNLISQKPNYLPHLGSKLIANSKNRFFLASGFMDAIYNSYFFACNIDTLVAPPIPVSKIESITSKDLKSYPNPVTTGILNIDCKEQLEEITIYNMLGVSVFTKVTMDKKLSIDVSTFSKGIYFLKVKIGEGGILRKIIIQ